MNRIYKLTALIICCVFLSGTALLSRNKSNDKTDQEKFRAQTEVHVLLNDNLKKLNIIEVISKNFGYPGFENLKKDYCTAKILISKKQIIESHELFKKNKAELDSALKQISMDYQTVTEKIMDECIEKINEYEFVNSINPNKASRVKLHDARDKLKIVCQQYDSASKYLFEESYVSSICLFRNTKAFSISILKGLSDTDEELKIIDKYKIHIVDNRNEVYKKG